MAHAREDPILVAQEDSMLPWVMEVLIQEHECASITNGKNATKVVGN